MDNRLIFRYHYDVRGLKVKGNLSNSEGIIEAPVNGGHNYNGPKVAKFLCRVSSDPHERRNDLGTVSTANPAKL